MLLLIWLLAWAFKMWQLVDGKTAIVSFYVTQKSGGAYRQMRELFLYSLRQTGYPGDIIFIATGQLDAEDVTLFERYNAKIKLVSLIAGQSEGQLHRYFGVMCKLYLWSLVEYQQLIYYDTDFVFLRDPSTALSECNKPPDERLICATVDRYIARETGNNDYFNSGFLVVRPNMDTFQSLLKSRGMADGKTFPDQDMLNQYYRGKWKKLSSNYNHMHGRMFFLDAAGCIAIHEKLDVLKREYPEPRWVWNSFGRGASASSQLYPSPKFSVSLSSVPSSISASSSRFVIPGMREEVPRKPVVPIDHNISSQPLLRGKRGHHSSTTQGFTAHRDEPSIKGFNVVPLPVLSRPADATTATTPSLPPHTFEAVAPPSAASIQKLQQQWQIHRDSTPLLSQQTLQVRHHEQIADSSQRDHWQVVPPAPLSQLLQDQWVKLQRQQEARRWQSLQRLQAEAFEEWWKREGIGRRGAALALVK